MLLMCAAVNALEFLELKYEVDWPINVVITSSTLNKYNKVFHLLLQMKRASWALKTAFHHLRQRQGLGEQKSRQLQTYRHQFQHFVNIMLGYMANQLFYISWREFEVELSTKVRSLAHKEYTMVYEQRVPPPMSHLIIHRAFLAKGPPYVPLVRTPCFFSKGSPLMSTFSYTMVFLAKGPPLCPTCSYTVFFLAKGPPCVPFVCTPYLFSKGSPLCPTCSYTMVYDQSLPPMSHLLIYHGFLAKDPHLIVHHASLAKGPPLCPTERESGREMLRLVFLQCVHIIEPPSPFYYVHIYTCNYPHILQAMLILTIILQYN